MYQFFDHTADLGIRVQSSQLNSLFEEAAEAMFSAIVEDITLVQPNQEVNVELPADDVEYLLFDWLKELLFYFDSDHVLFGKFTVEVSDNGLSAKAWGEPLDPSRHELEHEVKAVTYHELKVEQTTDGWLAEVIVDI